MTRPICGKCGRTLEQVGRTLVDTEKRPGIGGPMLVYRLELECPGRSAGSLWSRFGHDVVTATEVV